MYTFSDYEAIQLGVSNKAIKMSLLCKLREKKTAVHAPWESRNRVRDRRLPPPEGPWGKAYWKHL